MKNYIEDFCEDLNYQGIVLYIGELEDDAKQLLEKQLFEKDFINKHWRYTDFLSYTNMFYIENCDFQTFEASWDLASVLLENTYKFYELRYDYKLKKFYYETEENKNEEI